MYTGGRRDSAALVRLRCSASVAATAALPVPPRPVSKWAGGGHEDEGEKGEKEEKGEDGAEGESSPSVARRRAKAVCRRIPHLAAHSR